MTTGFKIPEWIGTLDRIKRDRKKTPKPGIFPRRGAGGEILSPEMFEEKELLPAIPSPEVPLFAEAPTELRPVEPPKIPELPSLAWADKVAEVKDDPVKLIPFVSSGKEIFTISRLLKTAKDLEDGNEVSVEDLMALKEYVDRSQRDTTWGYKVGQVITEMLPFAGEFIATGGIFALGKKAGMEAAKQALKRIATKQGAKILEKRLSQFGVEVAGTVAGGTLRALPAGATRIPRNTLEKQLRATISGDDESVWESARKAFGEQWVEIVSESTGGLFKPLAAPIKGQLVKMGLFKAFLKANPDKTVNDMQRVLNKMGYHGVLEEVLEERVADVGHGILESLGLSDQKFNIPSLEQLSVELAAFSIPGVVMKTIEMMPVSEAGFAKIPGEEPTPAPTELQRIIDKWSATKTRNAQRAESDLVTLEKQGFEVADARDALQEYRNTVRADFDTVEDFSEARTEAWENFTGELEGIEQLAIPKAEAGEPEAGLQPEMFGAPPKEVRPPGRSRVTQISMEDQLKLEEARRAAEEAPAEAKAAYEAQAEAEGLKYLHEGDPVANYRFQMGTKIVGKGKNRKVIPNMVGLDSLISIKEGDFPQYFTVKQAQALRPHADFSKYSQKGTSKYNKVPRDEALDEIAEQTGYPVESQTEVTLGDRVEQIRAEKRKIEQLKSEITEDMTKRPLPAVKELTTEDISEMQAVPEHPKHTIEQIDALIVQMADYIVSPNVLNASKLTRELQSMERAKRFQQLESRAQELFIREGLTAEQSFKQSTEEVMTGKLPFVKLDFWDDITAELRDAHFEKIYWTFSKMGAEYQGEKLGTITALTKVFAGEGIPTKRGTGSILFPEGGSAWDRLKFVFGNQPKVLKALEKMSSEKKPLEDVVEGVFHETGRDPIPIDQETADYLRSLPTWAMQQTVGLDVPGARVRFTYDPTGKLGLQVQGGQLQIGEAGYTTYRKSMPSETTAEQLRSVLELDMISNEIPEDVRSTVLGVLDKSGLDDAFDRLGIEMAREPVPVAKFEAPIEDAIKQMPLLPRPPKEKIILALKEIGMSPVDIGNFLRANKASFDFSFWRQQAPLIARHPISFINANIEAWQALWSQKSADASWVRITRSPLYQIYAEAERQGGGFLRPLEVGKGVSQYKGTEEFGFHKGVKRLIPMLTGKLPWVRLSQRAFETGTNVHNWLIFENYYKSMLSLSEQYASGQKKFKEGESLDIEKEMVDFAKMLSNFSARGSLGKFSEAAPALSGLFFAPRAAVGRLLSVKDLINANPRVRRQAWENASSFVGTFGGIVLLGAMMGWWDVEKDPRSAEYMSIRVGNMRIDPWGGFRQFLVFFTRAITQTGVSSVTGAEYEADPLNLIQTFVRGKASPLASLILDFWRGKNFIGEEVEVGNKRQWAERVAPFAVWDIYEAYTDAGEREGIIAIVPAILGAGVQTYTGDWRDNWTKLGLPKYSENIPYGINEPYYDTGDFWADTSSKFKGVDSSSLTKSKGFPEYIRLIAEARVILEHLDTLPNQPLNKINADPKKGLTFIDYNEQWKERERLVAAGDDAELTLRELQPDGKYKDVTYKGEDALKAFDDDERTKNAKLGNMTQAQYSLLTRWHSREVLSRKELASLSVNPYEDYLETHPEENAKLAIWGKPGRKMNVFSEEAYKKTLGLLEKLGIPDIAFPDKEILDKEWSEKRTREKRTPDGKAKTLEIPAWIGTIKR